MARARNPLLCPQLKNFEESQNAKFLRVAPLLTSASIMPAEDVRASFPEDSLTGMVEAGAVKEEQLKARTAD